MGTGKSAVAKSLNNTINMETIDLDQLVAKREGCTINDIFHKYGEEYFRNIETSLLKSLVGRDNLLVSCGGGVVLRDGNIDIMKRLGLVIYLESSPRTVLERVKDSNERPLINENINEKFIKELMDTREERYLKAADLIINTDYKTVDEVSFEILEKLKVMK